MAVRREYRLAALGGVPEIRVVTMADGSVAMCQGSGADEKTIVLHEYHAAEIAGIFWPDGMVPLFGKVN
jgi:hypothetical protein